MTKKYLLILAILALLLGQLVGTALAEDRTVQSSWQYDQAGNRISQDRTVGGINVHSIYTYSDNNELKTVTEGSTSTAYEYDDNGNLAEKTITRIDLTQEVWSYEYDTQNRLTVVRRDGAAISAYGYDVTGRRIREAQNGKLTIFIYDGIDVIYEESYALSGDPTTVVNSSLVGLTPTSQVDYARADGKLIAKIVPGTDPTGHLDGEVATYYHLDHLGSTRVMTDSAGQVVARMDYEPFGAYMDMTYSGDRSTTQDDEHFGYTGQRNEDSTDLRSANDIGLYYYGARFYDPAVGRLITQDSAYDGLNWYVYCNNNPLKYVDPDGRFKSPVFLRWLVPGQVAYDNAMTSLENGDHLGAGVGFGAMIGEMLLATATAGLSEAAQPLEAILANNLARDAVQSAGKVAAENVMPTLEEAAHSVAGQFKNAVIDQIKDGSWKVTIPKGSRSIVVRLMEAGSGGRPEPYFRVAVSGKPAVTAAGEFSSDAALTHFDLTKDCVEKIVGLVEKLLGK